MEYESFEESGINFSFPKEYLFRIEKSITLEDVNRGVKKNQGTKTAEFLFLDKRNDTVILWIVEAKTGTPQPAKEEDYNSFINDIKDKFCDCFDLFLAMYFERHSEKLPENFQQLNIKDVDFKFVLIITSKTYKPDWLNPLRDELHKVLKKFIKVWNFPTSAIMVINPKMAEELKLING